jgi:hypothetical protein
MFNLFKKADPNITFSENQNHLIDVMLKRESAKVNAPSAQPKREMSTIKAEVVHAEYEAAADALINPILKADKEIELAEKAGALGFNRSQTYRAKEEIVLENNVTRAAHKKVSIAEAVIPGYKFINREAVEAINKKYGLITAKASYFIGTIPETNLIEIEKFADCLAKITAAYWKELLAKDSLSDQIKSERYWAHWSTKPFMVSAPASDFDTAKMKSEMNMPEWGSNTIYRVEDPIVMQPFEGGFLIVSKWGEEGNDPMLVNEVNN